MMRVPLVMWMARNQGSEATKKNGALLISVELIPLQPDGYFSNLNIETQVHSWNSGWMWHTRTFPFPLPNYSLQFRIPRLTSCAQLAPWMGSQPWEEGGRGGPMSVSQDRLRAPDVVAVRWSQCGRALSFSKRGHSSQRMSEEIFRVSALFARQCLFCPFSCILSSWVVPSPRFPMQASVPPSIPGPAYCTCPRIWWGT